MAMPHWCEMHDGVLLECYGTPPWWMPDERLLQAAGCLASCVLVCRPQGDGVVLEHLDAQRVALGQILVLEGMRRYAQMLVQGWVLGLHQGAQS